MAEPKGLGEGLAGLAGLRRFAGVAVSRCRGPGLATQPLRKAACVARRGRALLGRAAQRGPSLYRRVESLVILVITA